MMLHCDRIQKQELNMDRDLKHQRKLDEDRIKDQDGIVRTLIRYMNEDLGTISGSINMPKDLTALENLKEAVEILLMQWEVVQDDFHIRQAAMLENSFPAYKQLVNEKFDVYFRLACATAGNMAVMEKETMTELESTKAELHSATMKIKDLEKEVADKDMIISQGRRGICDLQQAIVSAEENANMSKEKSESLISDLKTLLKENAENITSLQTNAKWMENKMEAVNVSHTFWGRALAALSRRCALALRRPTFKFTNAKTQKTNAEQDDQLKKLSLDLETHKTHADELRCKNTELEKELEKRDNKIKELISDTSEKDARLAGELARVKNEVEMYKSIVKKEADSSNEARLKDPLFDRMLAVLKAEKNKVEIYQLLLDQDVKYLNDNRLNGTLYKEGLHRNAPNKQYVRVNSYKTFVPDC